MAWRSQICKEGLKIAQKIDNDKGWKLAPTRFILCSPLDSEIDIKDQLYSELLNENRIIYEEEITRGLEFSPSRTEYRCTLQPGQPLETISISAMFLVIVHNDQKYLYAGARIDPTDSPIVKEPKNNMNLRFNVNLNNYYPDSDIVFDFVIKPIDRFDAVQLRSLVKAGRNCFIRSDGGQVIVNNVATPPNNSGMGYYNPDYNGAGIRPVWDGSDRITDPDFETTNVIRYHTF